MSEDFSVTYSQRRALEFIEAQGGRVYKSHLDKVFANITISRLVEKGLIENGGWLMLTLTDEARDYLASRKKADGNG